MAASLLIAFSHYNKQLEIICLSREKVYFGLVYAFIGSSSRLTGLLLPGPKKGRGQAAEQKLSPLGHEVERTPGFHNSIDGTRHTVPSFKGFASLPNRLWEPSL